MIVSRQMHHFQPSRWCVVGLQRTERTEAIESQSEWVWGPLTKDEGAHTSALSARGALVATLVFVEHGNAGQSLRVGQDETGQGHLSRAKGHATGKNKTMRGRDRMTLEY